MEGLARINCQASDKKIHETRSTDRRPGSGRPASAVTQANQEVVAKLILSQEDQPGTHLPPRKIAKVLNISRESVRTEGL